MILDTASPFDALEDTQNEEARIRQSLLGAEAFGPPENAAEAFGAASKAGVSPLDVIDPEIRKIQEGITKRTGIPMRKLVGSKTEKWAFKDPLTTAMVGYKFDPLLTMEDKANSAEAARVDAKNAETGRGALSGIMASLGVGGASLVAVGNDMAKVVGEALIRKDLTPEKRAEASKFLDDAINYLNPGGTVAQESVKYWEANRRETESPLVRDQVTGEERINWGAVNPLSLHGMEAITNMVAGEALPMLVQYLVGAVAAPETGGASLAAVTAANSGKLAKVGRFAKAVWSYAKSPVSVINASRVVQGQANEGVRTLMAQGYSESQAWEKVAPGALLSGLFSAAVGSPMEAKLMEDLFTKVAASKAGYGFAAKAAARMKAFASQGFKEGSQEVLEGLGEDLAAYITYQPDKTIKEVAANAMMNFVGGSSMGGIMGAGIHGSQAIHHAQTAQFIQSLHDEKARVEFSKQAPEKFAEFVHQLTEGGNLENLVVDAQGFERYYQSIGEDPKAFAVKTLGVRAEDFDVALQNGGDLIIPTSQYALHIAGTDNFGPIYNVTRAEQGGPTLGELHTTYGNEAEVQSLREAMKALPTTDTERDVLRDKVADMLGQATRALSPTEVLEEADSFAKALTVMAGKVKMTPTQLFEKNKLNIVKGFHAKIDAQRGVDYAFTGPDGSAEAAQVQGAPAGRVPEGLRSGAGRGDAEVRAGGPGGQETAASRYGFARGVAPAPMLWHGTEQTGITALKAEGIGTAAPGSMGPGLHVSAGPQVAAKYAGGNADGMFRVGVSQRYVPFDASTEKTYTVDEAAQLGITTDREMTGAEIWAYTSAELGMDDAVELFKGKGFDGLYYDHGGEDAWSVWSNDLLVGSRPTDVATAEADYARQGSRRDELTGRLKVAQMRLNQAELQDSVRSHLRNARRIIQGLGKNTYAEFKAELGWAPKKIKGFEFMGETGEKALRNLFSVAQTKEMAGAPPTIRTEADRQALVEKWSEMARTGESGRFWYDDSANAFLQLGGSELQAFKLATLTALYSPQTSVADNGRRAILAYYDAMHNMAVSAGGVHPNVKELAQRVMSATTMEGVAEVMSGQKTSAFQQNLIDLFAPAHADQDVATIDLHMMRAAGFENIAPSTAQYAWVEMLTREVAAELGWRPKEAQAAIWVAQKMLTDKKGKGSDAGQAGFHYGDAALKIAGSVNVEAMPGSDLLSGIFPGIANATRAQLEQYHAEKMEIVRSVMKQLGVMVADDVVGHGYWDGVSNPVTSFKVPMPHIGTEGDHVLAPSALAEIERAAKIVLATVNDQDAIGWMRPFYSTSVGDANGMHYALNRELSYEEMAKLGDAFAAAGLDAYIDASDPKNIKVVNYNWGGVLNGATGAAAGKAAKAYHTQLHSIILTSLPADIKASADLFAAQSGLIERGSTDGITDERGGLSAPGAPAADLGSVFAGREQIAKLNEKYRTEFGWGAEPSRGERPVFAERAGGPNPIAVNAVHFGTTAGLAALDPGKYSTSAGREGQRLRTLQKGDPLLQRAYFYEQTSDELPEKESVVKGKNPYEVRLTNLYDLAADLDGIAAENRGDGNGLERAVMAAGYDGYITPAPGIPGRAIVLLGTKEVPVREARSEPSTDVVVRLNQSAYHGSPHRFDKFTLDHMGTGEGVQAFGWGLYFADEKAIAENYRESLSSNTFSYDGKPLGKESPEFAAAEMLAYTFGNKEQTLDDLKYYAGWDKKFVAAVKRNINKMDYDKISVERGQLYKVDIPDEGSYLLWDKLLRNQDRGLVGNIRAAIIGAEFTPETLARFSAANSQDMADIITDTEESGKDLYTRLADALGSPEKASNLLGSVGLSGIKYLDGASRHDGNGSYNYVIFDARSINIMETYYQGTTDNKGSLPTTQYVTTELIKEADRPLGVKKILSEEDAAKAFAYLGTSPMERFDAIVTNKAGKPIAVVGGFKGGIDYTLADLDTILSSAFRVEGAAGIWFGHNHPSGSPGLSNQDLALNSKLSNLFSGSAIKAHGILAIGSSSTGTYDFEHNTGAAGTVSPDKFTKTPLVERVFSRKISDNSNQITSPRALKDWYANSDAFGKTGVLLLDTKSKPSAFVELTDEQAARLRTTGVMDELYRASSVSPHKSVIIIDPSGSFSNDSVENLQKFYEASGHPVVDLLRGNESQRSSGGFKPLGENESRMFRQGPRGFLEFPSTSNGQPRKFDLVLLENENKSTVFHELGHFYLELLGDVAADPQADESVRKDYDTILQWLGVTDRSQITREMHEKFADAHLVYLQEGKAPTEELHSPFRKFSKWLSKIGQQLLGVEVNMTDEVRGVFDRLYASDEEIEEAKSQVTTRMFTTAEQASMSAAEFEVYSKAIAKEAEVAKERLMARLIKELEREQKAEYREALEKMRTEVEADVMARPEYAALKALSDGTLADGETPVKLSRQALVAKYGKDLPKQLTRDANYVYTTEGGMDADAAAMLLGFESGDALVQALTNLEPRKAIIDRLTKNAMEENYPTLLGNPEQLRETAVSMLNGTMRENILATELRILKRKQAQAKPIVKQALQVQAEQTQEEVKAQAAQAKADAKLKAEQEREGIREASTTSKVQSMREAAKRHISGLSAWKIRPIVFLRMQQKAAKASYTAALKNDYAAAVAAKEQEMSSHFLYLEAVKAKDEAESFRDFVKRNDSATVRGKMGKAGGTFLAQFDALRDRFEIERLPNKELARRENLGEWARKQEENAGDVVVAEWIVLEELGGPRNYKELTMAELRDVRNALVNIKHLAYKELGEIIDGKRVEYEQMFEEFEQAFSTNLPDRKPLMRASDKRRDKTSHKAGAMLQGLDATMVKIEALINWIDGNNVKGPAHRYIWNRIVAAQNEDYKLTLEFNQHLLDALGKMPKEQREGLSTETFDGVMQDPVTRGEILTMLLYSGQETRRRKLLEGYAPYGLTEQSLQLAFSHLTAEDFKFAADVWATFDKLSPKILDLEERLTGIRPDWEKGRAFEVYGRDGELLAQLGGGYFPLVADPVLNGELAKKQEGGTVQQIMTGNGYSRAATSTGHTKELTGKTYPLLLDFQRILTSELTNQIKDLTHREAVLSINKILSNERFQRLVKEHIGEGYEQQLTPWLTNIASDRNAGSSQGLGAVNSLMMKARANTVAAVLGFKFSSMIVQLSDIVRVVAPGDFRVDATHLASAYAKLAPGAPGRRATIAMIRELSPEMAQRAENLDRDLRARLDQLRGDESLTAGWNRAAFSGLAMMDKLVSWPTWLGAYQQAMSTHGDQDQAVMEADRTVRMRLMTGAPKDLTPIQANKHWSYKAITMFMGDATNNYNMLRNAGHNINGMKGVPTFTAALMVVMLASILGDWLKGQMPEDPEEKAKWAARKALLAPMGTVPVVRDLASSFDNLLAGKPFTDYKFSPAFTAVQKVFIDPAIHTKRLANGSEEFSDYVINMGESAGYAFGVGGTSQAAASTRYFKRFVEGKERPDNALEFTEDLVRGKRKGQK